MGADGKVKGPDQTMNAGVNPSLSPPAEQAESGSNSSTEARFLTALQKMMGGVELTDDAVRHAIAKMTPEQKEQLMQEAGGQQLKRDMLTNEESKEDRDLYFKEVNRGADEAGLPVDKDNAHLAKKVGVDACHRFAAAHIVHLDVPVRSPSHLPMHHFSH